MSRIVYFVGLRSLSGVKKKTVFFRYSMGRAAPAFVRDLIFSMRMVTDSVPERRCLCYERRAMAKPIK